MIERSHLASVLVAFTLVACSSVSSETTTSSEDALTSVSVDDCDGYADPLPDEGPAADPVALDPSAVHPMADPPKGGDRPKICPIPKCKTYTCGGTAGSDKTSCDGKAGNADCTYKDASGTTHGAGSGICGASTSWSNVWVNGKPTDTCRASCSCKKK